MKRALLAVVVLLSCTVPAFGSDDNLDKNLPTELDDALTVDHGTKEIQALVRYADEREGHRVLYQPQLTLGVLPNTQFTLAATFYSGNVDRTGSGDVSTEILYNFIKEETYLPALAAAVEADFPTGEHAAGVDVDVTLLATKTLSATKLLPRVHGNAIWTHNAGRDRERERRNIFKGIVGFSVRAGEGSTLVLDYVREQQEEKRQESNLVEAGLRHDLSKETLLAIGAGLGLGKESEHYRITAGFQHQF